MEGRSLTQHGEGVAFIKKTQAANGWTEYLLDVVPTESNCVWSSSGLQVMRVDFGLPVTHRGDKVVEDG